MEASPMKPATPLANDVLEPSADDSDSITRLDEVLQGATGGAEHPAVVTSSGERVELPPGIARALARIARELAKGNSVAVVPLHRELTTHQAAAMLNVSRPHLIRMLDEGRLPFRKVGSHRRVRFDDVAAHLAREEALREALLARIARESQDMGLEL